MIVTVGDSSDPAPLPGFEGALRLEATSGDLSAVLRSLDPPCRLFIRAQIDLHPVHSLAVRRLLNAGYGWNEARRNVIRNRIEAGWLPQRLEVTGGSMALLLDVAERVQRRSAAEWRRRSAA